MSSRTLRIKAIHEVALISGWRGNEAIVATLVAINASRGDPWFQRELEGASARVQRGLWGLTVTKDAGSDAWALFDPYKNGSEAYRRWCSRGRKWDGHPAWPVENLAHWLEEYRTECTAVVAEQGELAAIGGR